MAFTEQEMKVSPSKRARHPYPATHEANGSPILSDANGLRPSVSNSVISRSFFVFDVGVAGQSRFMSVAANAQIAAAAAGGKLAPGL